MKRSYSYFIVKLDWIRYLDEILNFNIFYTDIFCNIYPVELKSLPFYCNNSNYIL